MRMRMRVHPHKPPLPLGATTAPSQRRRTLQPTFARLGIRYDARTARALHDHTPGTAAQLLAAVRGALGALEGNAQVRVGAGWAGRARTGARPALGLQGEAPGPHTHAAHVSGRVRAAGRQPARSRHTRARRAHVQALDHTTSRSMRQLGVRGAPAVGALAASRYSSVRAAYDASASASFQASMRKSAANPNALMEAAHLKPFADGGPGGRRAVSEERGGLLRSTAAGEELDSCRLGAEL